MYVPPQIKQRVEAKVKDCMDKAIKHFGRHYDTPSINYDCRGTTGGYAQGTRSVHYNPTLLMENVDVYLARTVPHEIAHIIDSFNGDNARKNNAYTMLNAAMSGRRPRRAKRSIHGETWQHICRVFGMNDITRCHKYDVSNAQVKIKNKFEYKCPRCSKSYFVSSVRHNRSQRGNTYNCPPCGRPAGILVYVRPMGQVTHQQAVDISQKRAAQTAVTPNIPAPKSSTYNPIVDTSNPGASNVDRARKIYGLYSHLGRGVCIRKMVEYGLKESTSSTYYQNFKSGK